MLLNSSCSWMNSEAAASSNSPRRRVAASSAKCSKLTWIPLTVADTVFSSCRSVCMANLPLIAARYSWIVSESLLLFSHPSVTSQGHFIGQLNEPAWLEVKRSVSAACVSAFGNTRRRAAGSLSFQIGSLTDTRESAAGAAKCYG